MGIVRLLIVFFALNLTSLVFGNSMKVIHLGKRSYVIVDGGIKHGLKRGSKVCIKVEDGDICGEVRAIRQRLSGVKIKPDELRRIALDMAAVSDDYQAIKEEAGDAEKLQAELAAITKAENPPAPAVKKGVPHRLFLGGGVGQETVTNKYLESEFNAKSLVLIAKITGELPFSDDSMIFGYHGAYHRFAVAVEETEVNQSSESTENTNYYGEPDIGLSLSYRMFQEALNASSIGLGVRYLKVPAIAKEGDDTGAKAGTVALTGPELLIKLGRYSNGSETGMLLGLIPTLLGKAGSARGLRFEAYWLKDVTDQFAITLGLSHQVIKGQTTVQCASGTCSDKNALGNTVSQATGAIVLKF